VRAINFPFMLDNTGHVTQTPSYEMLVRAQVIDALMTNQGERVFRPLYGCDIQSALFDPTDELVRRDAAGLIRQRLETLVTRCIVRDVHVDLATGGFYQITILYRPSLYGVDTEMSVPVSSEFLNRQKALKGIET